SSAACCLAVAVLALARRAWAFLISRCTSSTRSSILAYDLAQVSNSCLVILSPPPLTRDRNWKSAYCVKSGCEGGGVFAAAGLAGFFHVSMSATARFTGKPGCGRDATITLPTLSLVRTGNSSVVGGGVLSLLGGT